MRTVFQVNEVERAAPIVTPSSELRACDLVPASVSRSISTTASVILIERRPLLRECLTRCFEAALGPDIVSFASLEEWLKSMERISVAAIVLSIAERPRHAESVQREISLVNRAAKGVPIILLTDQEEPDQITEALAQGVRGYIPTSSSVPIAIEAMRLVRVGGTYIPASSLIAASGREAAANNGEGSSTVGVFTGRQMAVLKALRKGKPNKIIAYELGMCEATVKVHVRTIMKKLKAKNRTEAAYMASEHISSEDA